MKLELSKDWCMRMAELERDHEVGVGGMITPLQKAQYEAGARALCRWTYQMAGNEPDHEDGVVERRWESYLPQAIRVIDAAMAITPEKES